MIADFKRLRLHGGSEAIAVTGTRGIVADEGMRKIKRRERRVLSSGPRMVG
jgi:hypothetical protein